MKNYQKHFELNTGVRQLNRLFPCFLRLPWKKYFQKLIDTGIIIGKQLNVLAFADDVVSLAQNKEDLGYLTRILIENTETVGLKMNESKTKFMGTG